MSTENLLTRLARRWFGVPYLLLDKRMQLITNIKTNIDLATALDMAVEVGEITNSRRAKETRAKRPS